MAGLILSKGDVEKAITAGMAAIFGEVGSVIASAAIASVASQTASSMVMHQGNIKQVGKDLTSSRALKSYAIAGASAGLLHQLSGPLNLPTQPKGFEQHLKVSAVRAAVSTPLNIFIEGCNPGEAALNGLKCFAANSAGGFISENIGDAFADQKISELTRYLAHGGGGAVMGAILSIGEGDILRRMSSAAVAAMTAEMSSDLFSQGLKDQEQSLIAKAHREGRSLTLKEIKDFGQAVQMRADMAKIVGAASSLLVGRDVSTAFIAAHNAVEYNYIQHALYTLAAADVMLELYTLTHPEEAEAFKQRAIQAVADKTGFSPEAIEQSFNGMLMVGSTVGGGKNLLKSLGASLLKSEVGKRLIKDNRIRPINNRKPINSEYAGKVYPLEKLPVELRQKYPHSVPFTGTGHPDFSRYAVKKVEIEMTGKNYIDFPAADKAAGITKRPEGYTWHHHHDRKSMYLIPEEIHEAVRHTGGVAKVREIIKIGK